MGRQGLSHTLDEFELDELSDTELKPILDATNALNREARPRSTDLTADELRMFMTSPGMVYRRFLVRSDDGALAGIGNGRYPSDGTNAGLLLTQIQVLPEHRRKGVGTLMFRHLVAMAGELGRDRLQGFFFDTVPAGEAFATAVGATGTLEFHENVLKIADLDRELMKSWTEIGAKRAPGYSVRLIEGPVPEQFFDDIAHLYHVLERDMPTSADFEPREWTAERVAEQEAHYLKGTDALAAFACHDATGTAVGMSQMIRRKTDPTTWVVTVTMVDPEHRGRSLGKWVKGAVNVAALDRWQGGVYQETGNAFTNQPMLAINHAMGFEHEFTITDCSLSLDEARAYLDSR